MSAVTPISETSQQPTDEPRRRGCLFYIKRGLKWLGIGLVALVVLGVAYQTIATESDAILNVMEAARTGQPLTLR